MSTISSSIGSSSTAQPSRILPDFLLDKSPEELLATIKWEKVGYNDGEYHYVQKNYHPCFGPVENNFYSKLCPFDFFIERIGELVRMQDEEDPWVKFAKEKNIPMPFGKYSGNCRKYC